MERKKTKLTISGKPKKNSPVNQALDTKKSPRFFQKKKFSRPLNKPFKNLFQTSQISPQN